MSNYPTDETMEWIWKAKEKISRDLEGLSPEEILAYFDERSEVAREKLKAVRDAKNND